jgi:chemotaxis signal transduction protein
MPSGLAGFLDLRGTAVPVVRLDRLFDLPEQQPGLHTPMIVLRGSDGPIAILVESVRDIVPAPSSRLINIPNRRIFGDCATAEFQLDGEPIHLLSPATLLNANETRLQANYTATVQARLLHMEERREIELCTPGPRL